MTKVREAGFLPGRQGHRVVRPRPDSLNPGWDSVQVLPDGRLKRLASGDQVLKAHPREARFRNRRLGVEIRYGSRANSYDGPVIEERNGGGAAIGLFYVDTKTGEIFVGVAEVKRDAVGQGQYTIPEGVRGFSELHETHEQTARREGGEEAKLSGSLAERIQKLSGVLNNPNSTYFVTDPNPEKRTDGKGGKPRGVAFFSLELTSGDLTQEASGALVIKPELLQEAAANADKNNRAVFEKIGKVQLLPLAEVMAHTPDMFTKSIVAQWAVDKGFITTGKEKDAQLENLRAQLAAEVARRQQTETQLASLEDRHKNTLKIHHLDYYTKTLEGRNTLFTRGRVVASAGAVASAGLGVVAAAIFPPVIPAALVAGGALALAGGYYWAARKFAKNEYKTKVELWQQATNASK